MKKISIPDKVGFIFLTSNKEGKKKFPVAPKSHTSCLFLAPQVVKTSERRMKHLKTAAEELVKLESEMGKFNTWKAASNKELARQEECLRRY